MTFKPALLAATLLAAILPVAPALAKSTLFDLDGDGRADLVMQHTDGRHAAYLMSGLSDPPSATLLPAGTGWSLAQVGDFNGDGKSDLLWTHTDGRAAIWLMDGLAQVGGSLLLGAGTGWSPFLIGDFNGDGKADILWKHGDGRAALWLMNGASQAGGAALLPTDTGWRPTVIADFDNDGKADIAWSHGDGRSAIWTMDGARQKGGRNLLGAATGWSLLAGADFNGDRRTDLLWMHNDGRTAVWLMDGLSQAGGGILRGAYTGTPMLVGDIDGDGNADIVWQSLAGDLVSYSLLDGATPKGETPLWQSSRTFSIARLDDFNGDHRADIFVETDTGVVLYEFQPATGFSARAQIVTGSGWHVVAVASSTPPLPPRGIVWTGDPPPGGCNAPTPVSTQIVTSADSGRMYGINLASGETAAFGFDLPATANQYVKTIGWSTFETNIPSYGAPHEVAFSTCPGDFNFTNTAGIQCKYFAPSYAGVNARIAAVDDIPGACRMPVGRVYMNIRFTTLAGANTCSNSTGKCQEFLNIVFPFP